VKRKDCREAYEAFSARASENVRQLSYAALATVWLFSPGPGTAGLLLSRALLLCSLLAIAALAMDFLHSIYGTIAWGAFHRMKEKQHVPADEEFKAPDWINWPTLCLFWGKQLAIAGSYIVLFQYILGITIAM